MRPASRIAAVALVGSATLVVAPDAVVRADDGRSGDDSPLLCAFRKRFPMQGEANKSRKYLQRVPWVTWWFANRSWLLATTYRVPESSTPAAGDAWREPCRRALAALLSDPSDEVVGEAALALGRAGDPRDVAQIVALARDRRGPNRVRGRAVLGLAAMRAATAEMSKETRECLLAVAAEADHEGDDALGARTVAVWGVGTKLDPAASLELVPWLDAAGSRKGPHRDVHHEVLGGAVVAMGGVGDAIVLPELKKLLAAPDSNREDAKWVAASAAVAMARLGARDAVPALLEAARDRREEIRRAAFAALGAVALATDADAVACLAEAMVRDKDVTARSMAAVALGRIVDGPSAEMVRNAYAGATADVRPYLVIGLGFCARRTADAPTKRFLAGLLADGVSATETAALCLANGLAGNKDAVPHLVKCATTGDPETRCHAAFALGLVGAGQDDVRVIGALRDLVGQSADVLVRREAALALGLAKSRDALDVLSPIVRDGAGDRDVATAAVCLARAGGPAEAPLLCARLADRRAGGPLRASVAHALGWLLDRSEGRSLFRFVADDDWWNPSEATDEVMFLLD